MYLLWPEYFPYTANFIANPNELITNPNLNSEFIYRFDINIISKSLNIAGMQNIKDYKGDTVYHIVTLRL